MFQTAFVKKELQVSDTFVLSLVTSWFSTKAILLGVAVLLESKDFTFLQKNVLTVTFFSFKLP